MKDLVFAYPGDLGMPTGGYGYDRRIIAGLETLGWRVRKLSLGSGFPFPSSGVLQQAERRLADLPLDSLVVVDGLAFGVMQAAAQRLAHKLRLIALLHHPLGLENGLAEEQKAALLASEGEALKHVRAVIVTSPATAAQVATLFPAADGKTKVVKPGTERTEVAAKSPSHEVRLLSVGTVVPRKGYDVLVEALEHLAGLPWRLDIAGGTDADPDCFAKVQAQVAAAGLEDRVKFHGAVPQSGLEPLYRQADAFVLASRYEGYGMAYTEAIAYGLPVIGSGGGAVRDTLPDGAAIYCETGNAGELISALKAVLTGADLRAAMSKRALETARNLPTWAEAAAGFAELLEAVQTGERT